VHHIEGERVTREILMLRRICLAVIIGISVVSSGCATILTQSSMYTTRESDSCKCKYFLTNKFTTTPMYSGSQIDLIFLYFGFGGSQEFLPLTPFLLIDLPLSFAADTAILPYTLWFHNRFECTKHDYSYWSTECQSLKTKKVEPEKREFRGGSGTF
jgi:uncharacterized protein YceK